MLRRDLPGGDRAGAVGPEVGVASPKAFTAQLAVLTKLAIELGRRKHISSDQAAKYIEQLAQIPDKINWILEYSDHIKTIAEANIDRNNWLFLGRGFNYPVALEGALKLKEISYIHAEGLPAAEMKHGPIALLQEGFPVVAVVPGGASRDKLISNLMEVRARGAAVLAVTDADAWALDDVADLLLTVPQVHPLLQPVVTVVPLQLLAYHVAVELDQDEN